MKDASENLAQLSGLDKAQKWRDQPKGDRAKNLKGSVLGLAALFDAAGVDAERHIRHATPGQRRAEQHHADNATDDRTGATRRHTYYNRHHAQHKAHHAVYIPNVALHSRLSLMI
jgi:hypothetical protein